MHILLVEYMKRAAAGASLLSSTALLVLLGMCVTLGLSKVFENLVSSFPSQFGHWTTAVQGLFGVFTALAACLAAWLIARRRHAFPPAIFLFVLVAVSLAVHLLLILTVEPVWGTDYLRYWQSAQQLVEKGIYGPRYSSMYDQRALFIPYGVVRLFGPDAVFALKVANLLLLTVVQLVAYDVMRLARNHQAAQSVSVLLLAAPMPAYAMLIPSHDLWGLSFIAVTLWLCCRAIYLPTNARHYWVRLFALTLLVGLSCYLTELQRRYGTVFALALLLTAVISIAIRWRRDSGDQASSTWHVRNLLIVAMGCVAMQPLLGKLGHDLGLEVEGVDFRLRFKYAANAGGMSSGTSDWYERFLDRFKDKWIREDVEEAGDFALSIGLSNWILQPTGKLLHMGSLTPRLYNPGYAVDWDYMLRRPRGISDGVRGSLVFYTFAFGVGYGSVLLACLLFTALSRKVPPPPVFAMLTTVAVLSFALVLLFENKPFNIFPIWLAGPMFVAWTMSLKPDSSESWEPGFPRRGVMQVLASLALVATCTVAVWAAAGVLYMEEDGRILSDWKLELRQQTPPTDTTWEEALRSARPQAFDPGYFKPTGRLKPRYIQNAVNDGGRIQTYSSTLVTSLEFPAAVAKSDRLSLKREVCVPSGERNDLEFFAFAPYGKGGMRNAFTIDISADGRSLKRIPVPLPGRIIRRILVEDAVTGGGCHELRISLVSNVTGANEAWQKRSHIEIWLPRLVP